MNGQLGKHGGNIGGLILAVIVAPLVIFNAAAIFQASRWRAEIRDLTTRIADVKYQAERNEWIARRLEQTNKRLMYEDRKLKEKLSD